MSQTSIDHTIDTLARRLVQLRFDTPAEFFLEAHFPLSTMFHTIGLLFEPIATPFVGDDRIRKVQTLFSDRENLSRLMQRIEFHRKEAC